MIVKKKVKAKESRKIKNKMKRRTVKKRRKKSNFKVRGLYSKMPLKANN